ncbi:MAG: type II toxin-antitoxin system Phd/YefM family antitoxin [Candidatus Sumerlaeota bacterium]|nr:type II toxin-antitoxin system Phd/YefM family antitoxin [Candidatus Sumerlaeota bacterium]
MIALHPNYLKKNGKREFVILPVEEYDALRSLLEDAEDLRELRKAKKQEHGAPSFSLSEAKAMVAKTGVASARHSR